ncbi:unnamed protein product [Nippostrongylus brasiliensis]|uniref:Phlebovirus_G2 domain-containing protein n=1 Tax=Nippostrongylus brasiliensis TaxID=27835 RepID=A0A0N4YXE0_NIPBR|nr:unnamed protein product [Nippostrongylus brasiliensis]
MALILSMVTTSTTELITRHSLGTFQLSPNQDIECTKEGLFLNAPLSSAYEICVRTHCLKENTPPIRKIFKVPPKELLFEFEATWKLRYKENYVTVLKTCPAQPFCTTIDCTICSANILNPECWPVAAILGSGIVLYLLIAVCYTICYVPVTVGKPFRLLLQGIYDLVQLLLRAIIICACGLTNALRKRRRQQNILEALAILGLSLQGVFSCQTMNVLSHHIKSCTTGERKSCNIGLASVIKLNSFKRDMVAQVDHGISAELILNIDENIDETIIDTTDEYIHNVHDGIKSTFEQQYNVTSEFDWPDISHIFIVYRQWYKTVIATLLFVMAALVFTYAYFSYACRTILFASFKTMASYDNNLRNMRKTEEQRILNDLKHKRSNLKSIPTLPSGSDVQRKLYTFLRQIIRWTQNHGLQDLFAEIQGSRPRQFARGEAALYRAKVENVWLRTNHLKEMCYNARDGMASCYEMYKFLILAQSATEESRAAFFTEDADGVVLEPKFSSEYIRMEMEFLDELLSNMQNEMNQAQIQMNNEDHSSELCEVKQMMVDLQKTVEDTMCTIREEIRSQNERIVELINTAKITNETREEIRTILKDLKDDVTQVKTEIERKYDIEQRQRTPSEGEISEDVLDFDFEELPSSKTASDTKQNTHESDPKPVEEEVMNTHTNFREDTSFLEWRRRDVLSQMESLEHAIKMSHRTPRRCFAYVNVMRPEEAYLRCAFCSEKGRHCSDCCPRSVSIVSQRTITKQSAPFRKLLKRPNGNSKSSKKN